MSGDGRSRDLKPLIPQGVQCYFGEEVDRRRRVEAALAAIMQCWGFREIILPFFDYLEDFYYGLGSHPGDRVYRFLDRDGSLLALRPDLTTLVAKTVATRMVSEPLPVKLFYSGEVFRQERAGAGRQKEFYQIGLETLGSGGSLADIEILLIAIDCLLHLGIEGFCVALGHAGLFRGILSSLQLPEERADALRRAIDHKDREWLEEEVGQLPLSPEKKRFLVELPEYAGDRGVLDRALRVVENPGSRQALAELSAIEAVTTALGYGGLVTFDLAEVRGLDYYTGIVFRIYTANLEELGGGGRYDGLLARFGRDIPAVGFSFTLDRLLPLVGPAGSVAIPRHEGPETVLPGDGASPDDLFRRALELRRDGRRFFVGRRG